MIPGAPPAASFAPPAGAPPSAFVPPGGIQPQISGGPSRVPQLSPAKAAEYAALFEKSGAQNGILSGNPPNYLSVDCLLTGLVQVRTPNKYSKKLGWTMTLWGKSGIWPTLNSEALLV